MLHWIIKLFFFPVRFIPRRVELFLGAIVGLILYYVVRFKRGIVRENLLTAYGSEKDINRARINERVADNPLIVKGVQASGPNKADDIVISLLM